MKPSSVIGRFAPSPTGDLHFGSLVAAVGSYLEAKHTGGKWLLRIEDIDPPREVPGSSARIIADLARLGMHPDGPVLYQSNRLEDYQFYLQRLLESGLAYPCACSRRDLPTSGIYPGTCRNGIENGKKPRSVRFRHSENDCGFDDILRGRQEESPAGGTGDFVVRRADGLIAYQLAVIVDDYFQGITQVVRGADLLDSTFRQLRLQNALHFQPPEYMHLPIVLSEDGRKLGKRFDADPVRHENPAIAVAQALGFLGQNPPRDLSLSALWDWAMRHWDRSNICSQQA